MTSCASYGSAGVTYCSYLLSSTNILAGVDIDAFHVCVKNYCASVVYFYEISGRPSSSSYLDHLSRCGRKKRRATRVGNIHCVVRVYSLRYYSSGNRVNKWRGGGSSGRGLCHSWCGGRLSPGNDKPFPRGNLIIFYSIKRDDILCFCFMYFCDTANGIPSFNIVNNTCCGKNK